MGHVEIEIEIIAVLLVVVLVGAAILGGRIKIAAPLLLVVIGIGVGYLPFVPPIEVRPEIILFLVLPPLLYAAAVNTPLADFRRNFMPIAGLSVLLVLISALLIGWLINLVVPSIPFPVAVALGAVIAPTDAVAATSIGKRLGMPERLVSILEGESLVNDATSLVLLKTAIAAVSGSFVFWDAAGSFVYSVIAAIVIGYVIGVITVWLRSFLRNPVYDTVISFTVPFVAFVPAELIHASGVLAVVVTGLYTGHHSARRFSATARMNERLNWRTLQFVIENGVFLLMGLELHTLITKVDFHDALLLEHIPLMALSLVAILIVLRSMFMVFTVRSMRGRADRYKARSEGMSRIAEKLEDHENVSPKRVERFQLMRRRTAADLKHEREQQLGWREGLVLSWAGMRGVVTLAAAQSIPTSVPLRPQIVLVAFCVAVITLLLHGLTLPPLIRKLWPGGSQSEKHKELASLSHDLIEAGNTALDEILENPPANEENYKQPSKAVVERVRASARNSLAPLAIALPATGAIEAIEAETPAQAYLRLAREVLDAQRAALLEERAIGRYSSQALRAAELALDAHETRLKPMG